MIVHELVRIALALDIWFLTILYDFLMVELLQLHLVALILCHKLVLGSLPKRLAVLVILDDLFYDMWVTLEQRYRRSNVILLLMIILAGHLHDHVVHLNESIVIKVIL